MISELVLVEARYLEEIREEFNKNPEKLSDQLADILYWVLLIANDHDVDLGTALKNKIKKNEINYLVDQSYD